MEYMPKCLSREESDAMAARIREGLARNGFGWWAVEVFGVSEFIGFTGLSVPTYETHFTPCVEIGWRLARKFWGFGYATEAAGLALDYEFQVAGLEEIVSFTFVGNLRSRRVMERLGMTYLHDYGPATRSREPRQTTRFGRETSRIEQVIPCKRTRNAAPLMVRALKPPFIVSFLIADRVGTGKGSSLNRWLAVSEHCSAH
ncbi:MAG: GNAT family N-acetyltransferase [Verrucomicrobia bacterium]|nr:GNAT family N-acetyltransferase [Verrucomicrobiota bacterium]